MRLIKKRIFYWVFGVALVAVAGGSVYLYIQDVNMKSITDLNSENNFSALSEEQMIKDGSLILTPETASFSALVTTQADGITHFRSQMCTNKVPDYIAVHEDRSSSKLNDERVANFIQGKWEFNGNSYVFPDPIDWDANPFDSRTWRYQFNAWRPIHAALAKWNDIRQTDLEYAEIIENAVFKFAINWSAINFFSGEDYRTGGQASFIWYDMAAGHRAAVLGHLVRMASCNERITDEQYLTLLRASADHLLYLGADRFHIAHNNHGLYQSIGAVLLCNQVPELQLCILVKKVSEQRIQVALKSGFSKEGVHKEHSPQYHFYMLEVLEILNRIVDRANFSEQTVSMITHAYSKAQESLAWFIKPNGELVQFGDSDKKQLNETNVIDLVGSENIHPLLDWTIKNNDTPRPYNSNFRVFKDAGYAVYSQKEEKVDGERREASYLATNAAFHSRVHKHIDHLSFEWFDMGVDIIQEPGKYGYEGRTASDSELRKLGFYYSHPARIYVESPHAHNTLEIDATPDSRRAVKPYGSGLNSGGMTENSWFYTDASVSRKQSIAHRRILLLDPNNWLLVVDKVQPLDKASAKKHEFTQWFHLNPLAQPTLNIPGQSQYQIGSLPVTFRSLTSGEEEFSVHKGEKLPRYQGWRSNTPGELVANFAIGSKVEAEQTEIVTLIDITGKKILNSSFEGDPLTGFFHASWTYADGEKVVVNAEDINGQLVFK